MDARLDLSRLPGNICFSICQHTILSALCALLHRDKQIEKPDSDRGRVKSNRRNCKGNDTRCWLYRMHNCIMVILSLESVVSQSKLKITASMLEFADDNNLYYTNCEKPCHWSIRPDRNKSWLPCCIDRLDWLRDWFIDWSHI